MAGKPSTKLFYKIGEVCRMTGIKPHILRYWESEFPGLAPRKSRGGQRVYQPKDLEMVQRIKRMLYEEGYTIAGARKNIAGTRGVRGLFGQPEAEGGPGTVRPQGHAGETPAAQDDVTKDALMADALTRFKKEIKELLEIIS